MITRPLAASQTYRQPSSDPDSTYWLLLPIQAAFLPGWLFLCPLYCTAYPRLA